ncbi:MAG: hypothetical protein J2P46_14380 [Zavarzinella sp.]|nr:hypothetical protein [Zavarzinella sp.]
MITTYEDRLDRDLYWALDEAERFFRGRSFLHKALRRLTARLRLCGVTHALAGDVAYFCHGVHRVEDRFEILVTEAGLKEITRRSAGWGYRAIGETGRHIWDDECRVRISFHVAGECPGRGALNPVSFPDPESVAIDRAGLSVLPLANLVELSLAAAISEPSRVWHLANVVDSIRRQRLPRDFAAQLNPYVRPKFEELWDALQQVPDLE